ncbi:MAG TPA: glycosyltransferase [Polyangiaceae bacterium]|nr:glycosyltransferase [Polyangiaceae bacterium]
MTPDLRALVVSYAFPPVGGAGVQRVVKLVKYLPAHGATSTVLTAANPSVPLRDPSLERDIPPGTAILRARTLEPDYGTKRMAWTAAARERPGLLGRAERRLVSWGRQLLVPDPQVLWLPAAARTLAARLAAGADDVVFISGPPFSQFLLAALRRQPRTAVVLDYRDEWTATRGVYEMGGAVRANAWVERTVLRRAHAVTTATDAFRAELLSRFRFLDPGRVHAIPNGYDPEDFPTPLPAPPGDRFVLTYVGTVFRLTSARGLLEAIRLLHEREPEIARLLEVRFVGRIVETEAAAFEGMTALGVRRLGYLDHGRALRELARSHVVLCLLDDVPGAERIYPAKVFEIMYAGRPCLALTPEGALARLVRDHALGVVLPPRDPQAICAELVRRLRQFRDGCLVPPKRAIGLDAFHRRRLAGDFARVFRDAVAFARGPLVRTLERSESSDDTPDATVRTLERSESSDETLDTMPASHLWDG